MRRPWTSGELGLLRENAGLGASEVSRLLHRSPDSVECFARRYGISLRIQRPTCPSCGRWVIEVESTGYCRACHYRHLARQHRTALAKVEAELRRRARLEAREAKRELWTARQQLHRADPGGLIRATL